MDHDLLKDQMVVFIFLAMKYFLVKICTIFRSFTSGSVVKYSPANEEMWMMAGWCSKGICICVTNPTKVYDTGNWHTYRKLSLATTWKWPLAGERDQAASCRERWQRSKGFTERMKRHNQVYNARHIYSLSFSVSLGEFSQHLANKMFIQFQLCLLIM